jgi:hypothetical protein
MPGAARLKQPVACSASPLIRFPEPVRNIAPIAIDEQLSGFRVDASDVPKVPVENFNGFQPVFIEFSHRLRAVLSEFAGGDQSAS